MQETPPYSLVEIRILLSQYLDGTLDTEQMVHLDALMEQFPHYREEFQKLQATRDLVQGALERQAEKQLHFTKVSDLVWKNIATKLQADQQNQPQTYDVEFVSAYYDGEMSPHDPLFQEFESQLYSNAEANRLLGEVTQVSETVKQFGYRLEESCTLDISQQVMSVFLQETGKMPAAAQVEESNGGISAEMELLSAYVDQELSPRETIDANRLIENNPAARTTLGHFTRLSEYIQQVSLQIQAQAPDCWPAVEEILKRSPEEGGIIIPITRRQKQVRHMVRIAIPTVAAAVLLLFFLPGVKLDASHSVAREEASRQRLAADAVQNVAYKPSGVDGAELASVPMESLGQHREAVSESAMNASADLMPSDQERRKLDMAPVPLKPLLEPSPKLAAKPAAPAAAAPPRAMAMMDAAGTGKAPSSEEYLFNALNEQMPDEDISAILGK
jgi:anti-sigma factor RsiW